MVITFEKLVLMVNAALKEECFCQLLPVPMFCIVYAQTIHVFSVLPL